MITKKILFVVLAVVMLSFVGCNKDNNLVPEYPNVIVTGRVSIGAVCPPDVAACWGIALPRVVNDKGVFLLCWSENTSCSLEGFSQDDRISIYGTYVRIFEDSAYDFFRLTVRRII